MKTAKEMFEKLGYTLIRDNQHYVEYHFENELWCEEKEIIFDKDKKTYSFEYKDSRWDTSVDVETLKAITQQMKELGWLDDR